MTCMIFRLRRRLDFASRFVDCLPRYFDRRGFGGARRMCRAMTVMCVMVCSGEAVRGKDDSGEGDQFFHRFFL